MKKKKNYKNKVGGTLVLPTFIINEIAQMSEKNVENVKICGSILTLISGVTLCFISLFLPPGGVIDSSVLVALGELLTFTGSVWGISQYSSIQIHKINKVADSRIKSEE